MYEDDPILGLNEAFKQDTRERKINLGVGVYKTADLTPSILNCVKKAEAQLLNTEREKEYLPIAGLPEYRLITQKLLFGIDSSVFEDNRVFTVQTLGGSGSLRVGAEFLSQTISQEIYVPTPTWSNHKGLFQGGGMTVKNYPYFNSETHRLDFDRMIHALEQIPSSSSVLLHVCCHNPTGVDLNMDQWKIVSELMLDRGLLPFFDFAYQGFGTGIEEDAAPLRLFADAGHQMLVASSNSKNFGLYGERVGALSVVCSHSESATRCGSMLKTLIRSNYSSPSIHGARIVSTIYQSDSLRNEWKVELGTMRERIKEMRKSLIASLSAKCDHDYSFLEKQVGMFSFCGLNSEQVSRLQHEYGLYMPSSGRINVAGLNQQSLEYVVESIIAVL
ncbi:MAG: amino acid aminotransferase [Waddliaceae bacterium]|nr:amino acid aminotransferase [Waddliaceae bacterium]